MKPGVAGRIWCTLAFLLLLGGTSTARAADSADSASAVPPHPAVVGQAPLNVAIGDTAGDVVYGEPKIYMAWRSPYGTPGATDTLSVPYGDTTRVDTLFLSFETGRDAHHFFGMWGRVYIHPPFGDTLQTYWHFGRGWYNQGNMRIEFDPDGTWPCAQPWIRNGFGEAAFDFDAAGHWGRLDLIYALRGEDTAPVDAHKRYCFARIMVRQRKSDLPGAHQPACIEWEMARLNFGGSDVLVSRGPARFVSANSPNGAVCEPYRRSQMPRSWRPKGPTNPNQPPPHVPPR